MSTPAIRAALERLIKLRNADIWALLGSEWGDAFDAARAALAAAPEAVTEDSSAPPSPTPLMGEPNKLRAALNRIESLVEQANAAFKPLAELLDSPAAPPTPLEGEAGELVAWLRAYRDEEFGPLSDHPLACSLTRAAALLEQLSAAAPAVVPQPAPLAGLTAAQLQVLRDVLWSAQDEGPPGEGWASRQLQELREIVNAWQSAPPAVVPVPVSERPWEREGWCDAEERCWVGYPELTYSIADTGDTDTTAPEWRLEHQPLKPKGSRCCCLPAHALPLPAPQGGEGEA